MILNPHATDPWGATESPAQKIADVVALLRLADQAKAENRHEDRAALHEAAAEVAREI